MMSSGSGGFGSDAKNIQRLKGLGSAFKNLGYKNQLGTKQLQRLGSTLSNLPPPEVKVAAPVWTPPPVGVVSDRAGFQNMGTGPTMNFNLGSAGQLLSKWGEIGSSSGLAASGGGGGGGGGGVGQKEKASSDKEKSSKNRGGSKVGSSARGQGAPSSLSQSPYTSDLAKTGGFGMPTAGDARPGSIVPGAKSGVITDSEMGGRSALPSPKNPLANLNNPVANQNSLAGLSATPATAAKPALGSGSPKGAKPGVNQKNMDIAKGLDPTGGNNFLSGGKSEASAMGGMGGSALPGAPKAGTGAMVDPKKKKKKPGK